ncbi:hypothetical protein [Nitratireductor aquibiodomus]|uniref:hypothetical protein n=1 Tax=Nitratireductor aquibiodomus TaxID=204799 RepID=UPI001FCA8B16|nr:hypothetical protein [Nitratireductor aquibiodomus]
MHVKHQVSPHTAMPAVFLKQPMKQTVKVFSFVRHGVFDRHNTGVRQEFGQSPVAPAWQGQPICKNRRDNAFRMAEKAKPVRCPRWDEYGAGCRKRHLRFPIAEKGSTSFRHPEHLEKRIVAMNVDLPIVQRASGRKRFAVKPEIGRFV